MIKKRGVILLFGVLFIVFILLSKQKEDMISGSQVLIPPGVYEVPPTITTFDGFLDWMKNSQEFRSLDGRLRSDINFYAYRLADKTQCEDHYTKLVNFINTYWKNHGHWRGFKESNRPARIGMAWQRTLRDAFARWGRCEGTGGVPKITSGLTTGGGKPAGPFTKPGGGRFRYYRKPLTPNPSGAPLGGGNPSTFTNAFPRTRPTYGSGSGGIVGGAILTGILTTGCAWNPEWESMLDDPFYGAFDDWWDAVKELTELEYNIFSVSLHLRDLDHPATVQDLIDLRNDISPDELYNYYRDEIEQILKNCNPITPLKPLSGLLKGPLKIIFGPFTSSPPVTPPSSVCNNQDWFSNKANFHFLSSYPGSNPNQRHAVVELRGDPSLIGEPGPLLNVPITLSIETNSGQQIFQTSGVTNRPIFIDFGSLNNCGDLIIRATPNSPYTNCNPASGPFTRNCQNGGLTGNPFNVYTPAQIINPPTTIPGSSIGIAPVPPTKPNAVPCPTPGFNPATQICTGADNCDLQTTNGCDTSICTCKPKIVTPQTTGLAVVTRVNIEENAIPESDINTYQQSTTDILDNIIEITSDNQYVYVTKEYKYDPLGIGKQIYVFDKLGRFLKEYNKDNVQLEERIYYGDTDYILEIRYPPDRKIVFFYDNNGNPINSKLYERDNSGNYNVIDEEWYIRYNHPYVNQYHIVDIYDTLPASNVRPYYAIYEDKIRRSKPQDFGNMRIVESFSKMGGNTFLVSQKLFENNNFKGEVRIGIDFNGVLDTINVFDQYGNLVRYLDYRYAIQNCPNGQVLYTYDVFLPLISQAYVFKYNTNNFCRPANLLLDIVKINGESAVIYDPYPQIYEEFNVGLSPWFELVAPDYIVNNFL